MRKALNKLAALFHDGKVGTEIGIKYVLEAQLTKRRGKNTRRCLLRRQSKILRPCRANGRRDLHNGRQLRVGKHTVHVVGIVALFQRADRAVRHTLSAIGAKGGRKPVGACRADGGSRAGSDQVPDMDALHLITHLYAAHALDAAVFKAQNGRGIVDRRRTQLFLIGRAEQVIVVGQLLKLAVAAARALDAVHLMLAEQQLEVHAARHTNLLRVRVNDHAFMYLIVARGNERVLSLDLYHTDPACTDLVEIFEIAKRRYINARRARRIENAGSFRHADGLVVNDQCYHLSVLPPLKMP